MWTDGSKLDYTGRVGAAICWREKSLDSQKGKSFFLGKNKEILAAELWAISEALDIAAKETLHKTNVPVKKFCDSQEALTTIDNISSCKRNRFLRGSIHEKPKSWKITNIMLLFDGFLVTQAQLAMRGPIKRPKTEQKEGDNRPSDGVHLRIL